MKIRTRAYIYLLIASFIWGIAGPVIKYTVGYLPPLIFLFYRFAIAGVFALVTLVLHNHNHWPKSPSQRLWIFLYCFLNSTVVLGLLFLGYERTSAISGSVVNTIYPIIVAIVGVIFLKERVTHREKIGMGIVLGGTSLILLNSGVVAFGGNMLILASITIGVLGAVMAKLLLRTKLSPFALTQLSFLIGLITITPLVFYFHSPSSVFQLLTAIPVSVHAGVWYMALLSGTFAYTLWHLGQKSIEIGETAMFSYLYPIFAIPVSFFWLHEQISWNSMIGGFVIILGLYLAFRRS